MVADSTLLPATLERVNAYLQARIRDLRLPGLALAIVQDDQVIYQRGFGITDPTGRPVTPQTPFILGSLSKSITALAIMQLVEAGKIDLDAAVQRYLPWFRGADQDASSHITLRHLLTHTSGISRYTGRELLAGRGEKTLEQLVRELSKVKLTRPVGTTFQYSNANYAVLGLLVQVVSGESYEDYIRRHIFQPLSMQHSYTSEQDAQHGGLATGYRWWFGQPIPNHAPYLEDALPAAFLVCSAEDMACWLGVHLSSGSWNGVSVLSPAGTAELHRPQVTIPTKPGMTSAMGWRVQQLGDDSILQHGGEVSNFRADMVLVPGRKLGVIVLQNANNGLVAQLGLDQVALDVVRLLLERPLQKRMLNFQGYSLLLRLVVVFVSALHLWSLVRLLQRPTRLGPTGILGLMSEVAAAFVILWRVPKLADSPWSLLRQYVPDVTTWLSVMGAISSIKVVLRIIPLFRGR